MELKGTDDPTLKSIILERFLLEEINKLNHPAFIKFYSLSYEMNSDKVFPYVFVMEYGSVTLNELMEFKPFFPEEEIFYIMNELIDGLCKAQARKSSILELDANRSREI